MTVNNVQKEGTPRNCENSASSKPASPEDPNQSLESSLKWEGASSLYVPESQLQDIHPVDKIIINMPATCSGLDDGISQCLSKDDNTSKTVRKGSCQSQMGKYPKDPTNNNESLENFKDGFQELENGYCYPQTRVTNFSNRNKLSGRPATAKIIRISASESEEDLSDVEQINDKKVSHYITKDDSESKPVNECSNSNYFGDHIDVSSDNIQLLSGDFEGNTNGLPKVGTKTATKVPFPYHTAARASQRNLKRTKSACVIQSSQRNTRNCKPRRLSIFGIDHVSGNVRRTEFKGKTSHEVAKSNEWASNKLNYHSSKRENNYLQIKRPRKDSNKFRQGTSNAYHHRSQQQKDDSKLVVISWSFLSTGNLSSNCLSNRSSKGKSFKVSPKIY